MGHDLPVIRGQFVIRRFGVAAVGEMVVKDAKVLHIADPVGIVRIEMTRQVNLVDAFMHAAEGGGVDHIAQAFAKEEVLGRDKLQFQQGRADLVVLGLAVAIARRFSVVA